MTDRQPQPLYRVLAQTMSHYRRCLDGGNKVWAEKTADRLAKLEELLPSGSGFDDGVTVVRDNGKAGRLVLKCDFHHMDSYGYYDGWSYHTAIVTGDLEHGFSIRVTGRDHNDVKAYIGDVLSECLSVET